MERARWTWRLGGVSELRNRLGRPRVHRFFNTPRAGYTLFLTGVAALVLLGGIMAADSPSDTPAAPQEPVVEIAASRPLEQSVEPAPNDLELRFGWWYLNNFGSPVKVGEYQGLESTSPFWDVDTLRSDGQRTIDFTASGPESEATKANLYFYGGPRLSANLEYDRFLHRLDHLSPDGFNNGSFIASPNPTPFDFNPGSTFAPPLVVPFGNKAFYGQDLNAGDDYAIRVQEFKANFKGNITEDVSWGVRTFGMEKEGFRQAKYMAHCYSLSASTQLAENVGQVPGQPGGSRCHWLSQSQHIEWMTVEVEPYIEFRLTDWLRMEYSRTMRSFEQGDQAVFRTLNGSSAPPGGIGANDLVPYAVVPEATTNIDRLKVGADLTDYTNAYVLGYIGDNHNEFRDTNRHFSGVDARVSNNRIDGLQLTGYAKTYQTHTSAPTQALNAQYGSNVWGEPTLPDFDPPIDRQFSALGSDARWRPFHDEMGTLRSRMTLLGGYEYSEIQRQNAVYELDVLVPGTTPPVQTETSVFEQPTTHTNTFFVGVQEKWSKELQSTVKYRFSSYQYPMFGVTTGEKDAPDNAPPGVNAINSMLPTAEDRIEITNTWQPADNFLLNATFFIENSTHRSEFARFDEDRFPFILSAWYAPTSKWSLSAGYAQLTDWVDQDITLGSQGRYGAPGGPHVNEFEPSISFTSPWRFAGKSDVMNIGTTYAWTPRLRLVGGFEYTSSMNVIETPPSPPTTGPNAVVNWNGTPIAVAPYNEITQASMVKVNTYRINTGVDYLWRPRSSVFVRYIYNNYDDVSVPSLSGESHMFLTGVSASF